ncbi:MAG: hypothetical protein ACRDLD_02240 [Thermoleophilaceae bacterium]
MRDFKRVKHTYEAKRKTEVKVKRHLDLGRKAERKRKVVVSPKLSTRKPPVKITATQIRVSPEAARKPARLRKLSPQKLPKPKAKPKQKRKAPSKPAKAKSKTPSKPKVKARKVERTQRSYRRADRLLPGLDPEQTKVAAKVLEQGEKAGATRKELLAAAETGLVESGFRNLAYGDADSTGWRQERSSIYGSGPQGPRNVRQSAKRFFAESVTDTGGGRGKGMTAGELAQAIQGSAFPERYDERKTEAKPIVKAYMRGQKAPKAPKPKPGSWKGSKRAVLEVVPKGARAEGRDDKRTPEENTSVGGSISSDHLTTRTSSYAADLPPEDKTARRIAKRLGMASHTGTNEVVKDGYRYQLIWQDEGHYDHIHLGAEWVGAAAAASVPAVFTGGAAPAATTATSAASASTALTDEATATAAKRKRKAPARRPKRRRSRGPTPAQRHAKLLSVRRRNAPADLGDYSLDLSEPEARRVSLGL